MATTKVWPIHEGSSIQVVIEYVENPDKTKEKVYVLVTDEKREYSYEEHESMTDVMEYAMNDYKTVEKKLVSGINVSVEHARDEMNLKLIKEEMKKPKMTKEGLTLWLKQIQAMRLETKEHKQRLIDIFVNAVYLYDDKLVIAFNYKEATKTVSLKEVNGSIIECAGVPLNGLSHWG